MSGDVVAGPRRAVLVGGSLAVVGVLLAVAYLGLVVRPPPAGTPGGSGARILENVSLGVWNASNGTGLFRCSGCADGLAPTATVTVTARVTPACGPYGCSRSVLAATVALPFHLLATSPRLPTPLAPAGANLSLTIGLPAEGGPYSVSGSVTVTGPPGPAVLAGQRWVAINETGATGGMVLLPRIGSTNLTSGALFNESLQVNTTSSRYEQVLNLTVAPPFALVADGPSFPYEIDNQNTDDAGLLSATLRAPPDPGVYFLNGTASVRFLPEDIVASVNVTFTGVNASLEVTSINLTRMIFAGGEFNGSFAIRNPTNRTHVLAYNRTTGPWFFINGTPTGRFSVGPGSTVRFYATFTAQGSPGSYPLGVVFTVVSDRGPGCRRRATSARRPSTPPGHGAPGRAHRRPAPRPVPGTATRRRPG